MKYLLFLLLSISTTTLFAQSIDEQLKEAGAMIEQEHWNSAVDIYTNVLKEKPKNAAALFFRAYAYEQMGRYALSRKDYEMFLKQAPFNYEGLLGLALLNQKDKRFTDAYDQINNLIEMYPDSASAYMARAGMEKEQDMILPCIYDWGEVIKRDSLCPDHYVNRAELLIDVKRFFEAEEDLNKAVSLGMPESNLLYLYQRLKRKKNQKKSYNPLDI